MGKQCNMKYIGTVDNLIYYKWKDIYAVRTKPTTVKQTAASIAQSRLFGLASHSGSVLRNLLKPVIPDAKDRTMMRRFEQAIVQWLRTDALNNTGLQTNLPFITGFEFNEKSPLHTRLKKVVTINVQPSNTISIHIPALQPVQDITAPAKTTAVVFTLRIATCSLLNDDIVNAATKMLTVAYNNEVLPEQVIELPVEISAGMFAVVVLSLQYEVKGNITHELRWMPAGIAGSVWGG